MEVEVWIYGFMPDYVSSTADAAYIGIGTLGQTQRASLLLKP